MMEGHLCCECGHGISLPRHGTELPIMWCDEFKEDKIGVRECDRFQPHSIGWREHKEAVVHRALQIFKTSPIYRRRVWVSLNEAKKDGVQPYKIASAAVILRACGYIVEIVQNDWTDGKRVSTPISERDRCWRIDDGSDVKPCDTVWQAMREAFGIAEVWTEEEMINAKKSVRGLCVRGEATEAWDVPPYTVVFDSPA